MRLLNFIRKRLPQIGLTLLASLLYWTLAYWAENVRRDEIANSHQKALVEERRSSEQALETARKEQGMALQKEERSYQADLTAIRNRHQREITSSELEARREASLLEAEFLSADKPRMDAQRAQWLKRRGSDLEWALKNPDNGILEMLTKLTKAAAPEDADVKVSVDRFTEFYILVQFQSHSDTNQINAILRKVIPHSLLYLTNIRFGLKDGGQIACDLDQVDLAQIANWEQASDSGLSEMISTARRRIEALDSKAKTSPDSKPEDSNSREELTGLDKLFQVNGELLPQVQDLLNSSLKKHQEAVNLLGLKTSKDFTERQDRLITALRSLQNARSKLNVRTEDYEKALIKDHFTTEYATIAIRILSRQIQSARETLSAIEIHNRASSDYLKTMEQHLGNWKYLDHLNPPQIQFNGVQTKDAYDQARQELTDASFKVSEAIDRHYRSIRADSN